MEKHAERVTEDLDALWAHHHAQWRDSGEVLSQSTEASKIDPGLFEYTVSGDWWAILAQGQLTLLVTREYEHFAMALSVIDGNPGLTYLPLPHPSGLAVDAEQKTVYLACTRNPNQIVELKPATAAMTRSDTTTRFPIANPLLPTHTHFLPGCLYMHDLALIGGKLHANSVGQNAVIAFDERFQPRRVWWPKCIERDGKPVFDLNYLQLNSIATGATLDDSYFSASCMELSEPRPGHPDFPVDKRGVIFSGKTREPFVTGLTRPHSARIASDGKLWVDNSGYGEVGFAKDGKFEIAARLPGWTRGLGFYKHIAFVGTSRVIPRFKQYAPGLDVDHSVCGIHALDTRNGQVLGSIVWPMGNQIFAIDAVPQSLTAGFPFVANGKRDLEQERDLFYSFLIESDKDEPV